MAFHVGYLCRGISPHDVMHPPSLHTPKSATLEPKAFNFLQAQECDSKPLSPKPLYLNSLCILLLDWKQAFDSIDHNAMLIALKRFGVSERAVNIIGSLYSDPTFHTVSSSGEKAFGTVGSGIRQGCPLSPYLFIMVLSVIFSDLDDALLAAGYLVRR